jgi:hypothetical protein
LGVDPKTIRHAIRLGRIPVDALIKTRSANGTESYAVADPKMAAEAWAAKTPTPRGGRFGVPAQAAADLVKLRLARERRGLAWFVKREREKYIERAAVRHAFDAAAQHAITTISDTASARRVAGTIRARFLQEMKKR